MKRIFLALLGVCILGAAVPIITMADKETKPVRILLDSDMTIEQQETLVDLFVWVEENMPEQIDAAVREHQISVFVLEFQGRAIAGADWDREGNEPLYTIAIAPDFFTNIPKQDQKSILIHEFDHLNLFAQGHVGPRSACRTAFHEREALSAEIKYAAQTKIQETPRYKYVEAELVYAKSYLAVKCSDFKFK